MNAIRAIRFALVVFFALFSTFASAQRVKVVGFDSEGVTFYISSNGTVSQAIPGYADYTPSVGCSGTVRLSRTANGGVELVETGPNPPGFNRPVCLAKGLEGRGSEMLPNMILFDLEHEVTATRGPDGIFRATLPPSVRPTSTDVYVILVPTSTKVFDFSRVPCVDFGLPKALLITPSADKNFPNYK